MSLLSCSHGRCCCCLYPRLRPSVRPLPCFIASISDDDRAYQNDTTTTTVHMDLLSEITSNDDDDDQHALRFILPPFSEANDRLHLFTCAFLSSLLLLLSNPRDDEWQRPIVFRAGIAITRSLLLCAHHRLPDPVAFSSS